MKKIFLIAGARPNFMRPALSPVEGAGVRGRCVPLPDAQREHRTSHYGYRGHERRGGHRPEEILVEAARILDGNGEQGRRPALWDGQASVRMVATLTERLSGLAEDL